MPTQAAFDGHIRRRSWARSPKTMVKHPSATALGAGPLHIDLSLHERSRFDREGLARLRGTRRLHRVSDVRLALDLAPAHRHARGRQAGRRDRPASGRDPVCDAVRSRRESAKDRLARHFAVQLQRPVAGPRFLAACQPRSIRPGLETGARAAAKQRGPRPDRSGEDAGSHRRAGQPVLRASRSRPTSTTPISPRWSATGRPITRRSVRRRRAGPTARSSGAWPNTARSDFRPPPIVTKSCERSTR